MLPRLKKAQLKPSLTRDDLQNILLSIKDSFKNFISDYIQDRDQKHQYEQKTLDDTGVILQDYWRYLVSGQGVGQSPDQLKIYENTIKTALAPFHVLSFHRLLYRKVTSVFNAAKQVSSVDKSHLFKQSMEEFINTSRNYINDPLVKIFYQDKELEQDIPLMVKPPTLQSKKENNQNLTYYKNQLIRSIIQYYMSCLRFSPQQKLNSFGNEILRNWNFIQKSLLVKATTDSSQKLIDSVINYIKINAGKNKSYFDQSKSRAKVRQNLEQFNESVNAYIESQTKQNLDKLDVVLPTLTSRGHTQKILGMFQKFHNTLLSTKNFGSKEKMLLKQQAAEINAVLARLLDINMNKDFFEIKIKETHVAPIDVESVLHSVNDLRHIKEMKDVFWHEEKAKNLLDFTKNKPKFPEDEAKGFHVIKPKGKPQILAAGLIDIVDISSGKSKGVFEITLDASFTQQAGNQTLIKFIRDTLNRALKMYLVPDSGGTNYQALDFVTSLILTIVQQLQIACKKSCPTHNLFGFIELRFLGFCKEQEAGKYSYGTGLNLAEHDQLLYLCVPFDTRPDVRYEQNKGIISFDVQHITQFGSRQGVVRTKVELGKPNQVLSASLGVKVLDPKHSHTIVKGAVVHNSAREPVMLDINFEGNLIPLHPSIRPKEPKEVFDLFFHYNEDKAGQIAITEAQESKEFRGLLQELANGDQLHKSAVANCIIRFFCRAFKAIGATFEGVVTINGYFWGNDVKWQTELLLGRDERLSDISTRLNWKSKDYFSIGANDQQIIFNLKEASVDFDTNNQSKYMDLRKSASVSIDKFEAGINHPLLQDKFAIVKFNRCLIEFVYAKPGSHISDLVDIFNEKEQRSSFITLLQEVKKEHFNNIVEQGISQSSAYYRLLEKIIDVFKKYRYRLVGDVSLTFVIPDNGKNRLFTLSAKMNAGHGIESLGFCNFNLTQTIEKTDFKRTNLLQYKLPETDLGAFIVRLDDIGINADHRANKSSFQLNIKTLISNSDWQKALQLECIVDGQMEHVEGGDAATSLMRAFETRMQSLSGRYKETMAIADKHQIINALSKGSAFYRLAEEIVHTTREAGVSIQGTIKFIIKMPDDHKNIHGVTLSAKLDNGSPCDQGIGTFSTNIDYTNPQLVGLTAGQGLSRDAVARSILYPFDTKSNLGVLFVRMDHLTATGAIGNQVKDGHIRLNLALIKPNSDLRAVNILKPDEQIGDLAVLINGEITHPDAHKDAKAILLKAFYSKRKELADHFDQAMKENQVLSKDNLLQKSDEIMKLSKFIINIFEQTEIKIFGNININLKVDGKVVTLESHLSSHCNQKYPPYFRFLWNDQDRALIVPLPYVEGVSLGNIEVNVNSSAQGHQMTGSFALALGFHKPNQTQPYAVLKTQIEGQFFYPRRDNVPDAVRDIQKQIAKRADVFINIYKAEIEAKSPSPAVLGRAVYGLMNGFKDAVTQANCRLVGSLKVDYEGNELVYVKDQGWGFVQNLIPYRMKHVYVEIDTAWKDRVIRFDKINKPASSLHHYADLPVEQFLENHRPHQIIKAGVDFEALRRSGQRLAMWHVAFATVQEIWSKDVLLENLTETDILTQIMGISPQILPLWHDVLFEEDVFIDRKFCPFGKPEDYFKHLFDQHKDHVQQMLQRLFFSQSAVAHYDPPSVPLSVTGLHHFFKVLGNPKHQALLGSGYGLSDTTLLFSSPDMQQKYMDLLTAWQKPMNRKEYAAFVWDLSGAWKGYAVFIQDLFSAWQEELNLFIQYYNALSKDVSIDDNHGKQIKEKFLELKKQINVGLELHQIYEICEKVDIYTQPYLNWLHVVESGLSYGQSLTKEHIKDMNQKIYKNQTTNLGLLKIDHKATVGDPLSGDYLKSLIRYLDKSRQTIQGQFLKFNSYIYANQLQASFDTIIAYIKDAPMQDFFLDNDHKEYVLRIFKKILNVRDFLPKFPLKIKELIDCLLQVPTALQESVFTPLDKYYPDFVERRQKKIRSSWPMLDNSSQNSCIAGEQSYQSTWMPPKLDVVHFSGTKANSLTSFERIAIPK